MSSLFWNYNPIAITYYGLSSLGSIFSNSKLNIKKVDKLDDYNLLIVNLDNVLIDNNYEPKCLAVNSFNNLISKCDNICILSLNNRLTNKTIKKKLNDNGFNITNNIKFISTIKLSIMKINEILESQKEIVLIKNQQKYKKNKKSNSRFLKNIDKILDKNTYQENYNIGIIGNRDLFYLVKYYFNNIYLNINYYWVEDDIIPEECNLTIIGSPDNNEKINKNLEKWFCNIKKTEVLIMNDVDITDCNYYYSSYNLYKKLNLENTNVISEHILDKKFILSYIEKLQGDLNLKESKILNVTNNYLLNSSNIDNCLSISNNSEIINKLENQEFNESEINYLIPDISYLLNK